jgi:hypothetical protein
MKVSDDLTALVFELQRAHSPADKAKALARAWRTVRGLSGTERRLLAREVGFDGAEDLVEGLAARSGGAFSPASVLEALGRMRKDQSLTVRGILTDLKSPDGRGDLLERGVDLVVGDDADADNLVVEADVLIHGDHMGTPPGVSAASVQTEDETEPVGVAPETRPSTDGKTVPVVAAPALPLAVETTGVEVPTAPSREPEPVVENDDRSDWNEMWAQAPARIPEPVVGRRTVRVGNADDATSVREPSGSVFHRLRAVRNGIAELRRGGIAAVVDALDTLTEPWAKRRALVALIQSGIPDDAASTLDLIEELERPMDRRWCLSALAGRGDLEGDDLERALEMLTSQGERRRVAALASRAQ